MKTIRVNRDSNGKPSGITAKRWQIQLKLRQTEGFKHAIRVNVNRSIRETVKKRLIELEEKRKEAMKNWTKQL